MSESAELMAAERLASLGRAAIECRRFASPQREGLGEAWGEAVARLKRPQRKAALQEVEGLLAPQAGGPGGGGEPTATGEPTAPPQELLRQRASLELKLQTEAERCKELEAALRREQNEQREALQSLSLQQRKLKEFQEERSRLLSEVGQIESKLRLQINETEQVQLKYDKLKSSRKSLGDQATEQTEQITALKAENERLRQELEAARQERDTRVTDAETRVAEAEAETAETVMKRLWAGMQTEIPEVFAETHVPTQRTFEHVCAVLVEFVRAFATLELHVHHMLRDLRQVSERADKLNHFYIMFTKNPGLVDTLRDYLSSGKRKGNFSNLLRAQQVWARAFGSGAYKAIVRSPVLIGEELNYRSWPIKSGFTVTEDAALGKYFKEEVHKAVPEKVGTTLRRHAADMAYEDYNNLMKRQR